MCELTLEAWAQSAKATRDEIVRMMNMRLELLVASAKRDPNKVQSAIGSLTVAQEVAVANAIAHDEDGAAGALLCQFIRQNIAQACADDVRDYAEEHLHVTLG